MVHHNKVGSGRHQPVAETVQSHPPTSGPQHAPSCSRNSNQEWPRTWGLDRDGILLIGVIYKKNRRSNNDVIAGLVQGVFIGDEDQYCRGITDSVRNLMSVTAASLIKVSIEEFDGNQICRVECRKSEAIVFLSEAGKKDFSQTYVRYGSSTTVLPAPDISRWAEQHDVSL